MDCWDINADVQEFVNFKFYSLYNEYIKVGNESEIERNALKRWFVVQYFVYLLSVLVDIPYPLDKTPRLLKVSAR